MRYIAICALLCAQIVYASLGDRLIIFDNFLKSCFKRNCSSRNILQNFESSQPIYLKLFGWDCLAECKLQSQWSTLEQLRQNNVDSIPQFYGKWTFYRLFGIQEPASFIFSVMNFSSNLYGWLKYRTITAKSDPLYNVWKVQTFITLNAWFWSTIYHGRDTPLSEKLDYYSAYSVVIYSLCAILIKLLSDCESRPFLYLSISVPFVAFYVYHTHYLHSVHFDYGYNMKVNVVTGLLTTFCWLFWCFKYRKSRKHVWKCFICLLCVNLCLLFELMDFPPLAFIFDAHSLWHLCTFPLPLLWFNFLTEEALHLASLSADLKTKKLM